MSFLSLLKHLDARTNQVVLLAQDGDGPVCNGGFEEIKEDDLDETEKIIWYLWNQDIWASNLFKNVNGNILRFVVKEFGNGQNFFLEIERIQTHKILYRMVVYLKPLERYKHDEGITDNSIHQVEAEFCIEGEQNAATISTELDDIKHFMRQNNWREVCDVIKATFKDTVKLALLFVNYSPDGILIFKLCNPSTGGVDLVHAYNIFLGFITDGADSLYLEIACRLFNANASRLGADFRRMVDVTSTAIANGKLNVSKLKEDCRPLFDKVFELMNDARAPRPSEGSQ
jgi:hypothetical protein